MPVRNRTISPDLSQGGGENASTEAAGRAPFDLRWTMRVLFRNARFIAGMVLAVLVLAAIYLAIATPLYTATGELIFDLREPKIVSANPILQSLGADQYVIDSQVEVVRSLSVAKRVINQLELRPKVATFPSFWPHWLDFTGSRTKAAIDDIPQSEYEAFLRRLTVQRKGVSFVILVSYSHPDPVKAAAITNAVMDAYTSEQKRVKVETISAANSWLQSRVDELRQKVIESERRVQQFKTEDAAIDAKVMNAIYATFLTRLKETQSQEALQSSDARIVSAAVAPTSPSSPKKLLTLAFALALGLSFGAMIALVRGMFDPVLHDVEDVTRATDLPILAELPYRPAAELRRLNQLAHDAVPPAEQEAGSDDTDADVPSRLDPVSSTTHRAPRPQDTAYGQAIFTLRQTLLDGTAMETSKLVAVVSPRAGEGKTTTAVNLAREAAAAGLKTLLVDTDLRSGAATQLMSEGPRRLSLVDYVAGTAALTDTLIEDPCSSVALCPVPDSAHAVERPSDIIAGRGFIKAARDMRKDYDLVVLDTPGFLDYPDSRALLRAIDRLVIVVDLGQTTRRDLAAIIKVASTQPSGLAGIAVNTSGRVRTTSADQTLSSLAAILTGVLGLSARRSLNRASKAQ